MWTTFHVILLSFSFLAAALQGRAENDNLTHWDVLFEGYRMQTALVARNPQGRFRNFVNAVNPFKPSRQAQPPPPPQPQLPPSYEQVQTAPQRDVVVVPLRKEGDYRIASMILGTTPTEAERFNAVVHTNSPCFWAKYNPSQSHSGKLIARRKTCDSRLSETPTVSGDVYQDEIKLYTMTEDGMVLRVETTANHYSGEIGLALPTVARAQDEMMFVPDFILKRFPEATFALHLTPEGGELHIGKLIQEYCGSNIEYHKVTKAPTYLSWQQWQIGSAVIGINGDEGVLTEKNILSVPKKKEKKEKEREEKEKPPLNIETVFDSTLPFIYGPPNQVKKIYEAIRGPEAEGGIRTWDDYAYPCKKQVKLHFKWNNGRPWTLNADRFKWRELSSGICEGIIRDDSSVGRGPWVIGYVFMEGMYMVFRWTAADAWLGLAYSALVSPPSYPISSEH